MVEVREKGSGVKLLDSRETFENNIGLDEVK